MFVARDVEGGPTLGLYSLSFSHESSSKISDQRDRQIWGASVPLAFVGYLAVQRTYQGCGLGTVLLINALQRIYSVSRNIGFYGVGLRSLNDRTTALYARYGFVKAPNESALPLMILPIMTLRDLFDGPSSPQPTIVGQ